MSDLEMRNMSTGKIAENIQTFVFDKIPKARKLKVGMDEQLLENGLIDSLGILDVVTFLEEEYKILVDDEEMTPENFQSINLMANYVKFKINEMQ